MPEYRRKCNSYEELVHKMKKKTTDDIFTPPDVYDGAVAIFKAITGDRYDSYKVIRPFYPGGDYRNVDYSGKVLVLDNPPFSKYASICKWYADRNIPYFLFGSGLTLFQKYSTGFVIVKHSVRFDEGAIPIGFASNCFSGIYGICGIGYQNGTKQEIELPDGYMTSAKARAKITEENDINNMKQWAFHRDQTSRKAFGLAFKVEER